MEEVPDELLARIIALTAEIEADGREFAGIEARIKEIGGAISGRVAQAAVAVAAVSDALVSAGEAVDEELGTMIDPAISEADAAVQAVMSLRANLGGATDGVQAIIDQMEKVREGLPDRFDALTDPMEADLGNMVAAITDIETGIEVLRNDFLTKLTGLSDTFDEAVKDNLLAPLEEEAERLVGEWRELLDDAVDALLIDLFEKANTLIKEPLDEALDRITEVVRAEFEDLRQELIGGDLEGQAERQALNECMDALEASFEPLKAAFDGFRNLASTVGVGL